MEKHEINMFSSNNPEIKAGMAERLIRTLRSKLARLFRARGNKKYWDVLPQIIDVYNSTVHSSHNMAPKDVTNTNSLKVFNTLYKELLETPDKTKKRTPFKEGDLVRIYIDKSDFVKGYMPNFQDTVSRIERVIKHHPRPVYVVKSEDVVLPKRFYAEELSRVRA
jgi:hypothetical protein